MADTILGELVSRARERTRQRLRDDLRDRLDTVLPLVADGAQRTTAAALRRQGRALGELRRSHDRLARKVEEMQEQADQALVALLEGLRGLSRQVDGVATTQRRTVAAGKRAARTAELRQRQAVKARAAVARAGKVNAALTSTQVAAYGQTGNPLATANLLLAGNQLLWSFLDPLVSRLAPGLARAASPSLLAWLAPLGSLLTGHLALGTRQNIRFVSGVTTVDRAVTLLTLRDRIADRSWPAFQRRTDIPVSIVVLDFTGKVTAQAQVRGGALLIAVPAGAFAGAAVGPVRVAWMVDTGAPE
jgi:hypothetical protein